MTSHDVVDAVRRQVGKSLKVGHLGTLDPAASGTLPVAVGRATRWISHIPPARKQYVAEVTLGLVSDTLDAEGNVEAGGEVPLDWHGRLPSLLAAFQGTVMQAPPQVSAIQVEGRRAYDRARAGESFELPARPATYHSIEVLRSDGARMWLSIDCGPGTYVRALARDVGQQLGCGALLSALIRTRSGRFRSNDGMTLEELPLWRERLLPIPWPFLESEQIELGDPDRLEGLELDGPRWATWKGGAGLVQTVDGNPALVKRL